MGSPPNILRPESLLRIVAGLLLGLLVWTGNELVCRVKCLEIQVDRIMVRLGIEPQAHEKPGAWGLLPAALGKPVETNSQNSVTKPLTGAASSQ